MKKLPNSYYNIPYIDIEKYQFGEEVNVLSKTFCKRNKVITMEIHKNILVVCMGNPCEKLLNKIKKETGKFVTIFKSCPNKIMSMINITY